MTSEEHAEYNYSNSLVKARNPYSMNPYLIGSTIWYDIEDRWNKGRHGEEWEEEPNLIKKNEWDTKEMQGWEKVKQVLRTCHDWFFMNEFLTNDLTKDLDLYLYIQGKDFMINKLIVTDHDIDQIRQIIVRSFSHSGVPRIRIVNGNYENRNSLLLEHEHIGIDLDETYTLKTIEHIYDLWGNDIFLRTIKDKVPFIYSSTPMKKQKGVKVK
jgi:stage V sporulation protein R